MSANDVLDFAIRNEEEARDFYRDLAGKIDNKAMQKILEGVALEEEGHRKKLLNVKSSGGFQPVETKVVDLKISDYLVVPDSNKELEYQDILILVMKREKAAFKLYINLAETATDPALRDIMIGLANEEAKHKLHFEVEYDTHFLKDM